MKPDLLGNYKTFKINETTGWISLNNPLNREKQKIYELRIEAADKGIPTSLSSDLELVIYVKRSTEYEPQFIVDSIRVNFTEHSKPGTEKRKLPDTVDKDEVDILDDPPSIVCYFLVHGNEEGYFSIDPQTHVLSVMKELDREKQSNYTLVIKATEDCLTPPKNLMYNILPEALEYTANDDGKYEFIKIYCYYKKVENQNAKEFR